MKQTNATFLSAVTMTIYYILVNVYVYLTGTICLPCSTLYSMLATVYILCVHPGITCMIIMDALSDTLGMLACLPGIILAGGYNDVMGPWSGSIFIYSLVFLSPFYGDRKTREYMDIEPLQENEPCAWLNGVLVIYWSENIFVLVIHWSENTSYWPMRYENINIHHNVWAKKLPIHSQTSMVQTLKFEYG